MDDPVRRPEEILAYRRLDQMLGSRRGVLWTVAPADNAMKALQIMAEKNIGFLVVLDQATMVGVLSERDCIRHLARAKTSLDSTPVADIMARDVVIVGVTHTFADCLRLMNQHGIRHLPVIDQGTPIAVISLRDLLREAVTHHARIIAKLELERLTFFTSTA